MQTDNEISAKDAWSIQAQQIFLSSKVLSVDAAGRRVVNLQLN